MGSNYTPSPLVQGQRFARDFGCKNDGIRITDAVTTNASPTVTSAGSSFTSADVGKAVCLYSGVHQNFNCSFTGSSTTATCASTANLVAGMHVSACKTVSTTGTIASGSTTISVLGTTTGLVTGMIVSGIGIAPGTTISSINTGASTMVVSLAVNGTGSGVSLTFAKYIVPLDATIASITNATDFVLSAAATSTSATLATDFVPDWIVTTIAAVNSATSITLADNAVKTATGVRMLYGTDNTAAFQSAYDALDTIGGVIVCDGSTSTASGFYMLAGALQDTGNRNSVIKVPNRTTGQIVEITLQGAGPVALESNGFLDYTPSMAGTVIFCPTKASGTTPAMFSGNNAGGFTLIIAEFLNITFRRPQCSDLGELSFYNGGGLLIDECVIEPDYGIYSEFLLHAYQSAQKSIIMPNFNNGGACRFHNSRIGGSGTAIQGSQHCTVLNTDFSTCRVGCEVKTGEMIVQFCHFVGVGINFFCATGNTGLFRVSACLENQPFGPFVNTYDVFDTNGTGLIGKFDFTLLTTEFPRVNSINLSVDYQSTTRQERINPSVTILDDGQRLVLRQLNANSTIGFVLQGIDAATIGSTFGGTAFGGFFRTKAGTGITYAMYNASDLGATIHATTGLLIAPTFTGTAIPGSASGLATGTIFNTANVAQLAP